MMTPLPEIEAPVWEQLATIVRFWWAMGAMQNRPFVAVLTHIRGSRDALQGLPFDVLACGC